MRIREVEDLVKEWIEGRTIREKAAVTSNYTAFGDFLMWLEIKRKSGVIDAYQWISAIRQAGLEQVNESTGLIIRGIRLKGSDEKLTDV